MAVAAIDGRLYAVGGRIDGDYSRNLASNEAYDPASNRWEQRAPMPTARSGIAAASSIVSSRRSGRRAEPALASAAGEGERSDKRDTARRRHATDASAKAHDSVAMNAGDVWPEADRKFWLQLLKGSFKLIYKDRLSMREQAERARLEKETKDEAAN